MKQIYILTSLLLLIFSEVNAQTGSYHWQVQSINSISGGNTYNQNATPNDIILDINQCSGGNGQPNNLTNYTLTWYVNSTNSNSGGTVYSTSSNTTTINFNPTLTFTPPTNVVGTFYYYAEFSNPSLTTCGFTTILTSTSEEITINCNPVTGTDTRTECNSLVWIDGNTYTASNNSATYNIVGGAANGCDSLVTLDLTIINSATGTDTRSECNSFTWIDGNTYTANNNTATFNVVNGAANSCDSLVTLNLTINSINVSVTTNDPAITANAAGASYQWLDCDNNNSIISGKISQTFTATSNGNYSVEITENGCTDTSSCATITTVSIGESHFFNQVSIYPNPNQGLVNIDLGKLKNVSIKVFNVTGQLVYKDNNINMSTYQLEIKGSKGVYIIELNSNNEKQKYKLIIE